MCVREGGGGGSIKKKKTFFVLQKVIPDTVTLSKLMNDSVAYSFTRYMVLIIS